MATVLVFSFDYFVSGRNGIISLCFTGYVYHDCVFLNISSQCAWQGIQSVVGFLLIIPTLNFFQLEVYMFKACQQNMKVTKTTVYLKIKINEKSPFLWFDLSLYAII